jgi:hypothetical protein
VIEIALLIAVVVALTELAKKLNTPAKYLPLVSLLLGLLAGIFYLQGALKEQILYGIMIGLSAAGLFDQTKIIKK